MEGDIFQSFSQPSSLQVTPFNFILNNHFINRVNFDNGFDPIRNGYLLGFLTSIFSMMIINNKNEIDDVFLGILDNNRGFKCFAAVFDVSSRKTKLLVRNFFFESDPGEVDHGGISESERKHLENELGKNFKEEIVEYLVYDINTGYLEKTHCHNKSNKIIHPYIEQTNIIRPGNGSVEKFVNMRQFLDLQTELLYAISKTKTDGLDAKIFRSIAAMVKQRSSFKAFNLDLQGPFKYGFIHGSVFSAQSLRMESLQIRAQDSTVRTIFQKRTFIYNIDFSGTTKLAGQASLNLIDNLVSMTIKAGKNPDMATDLTKQFRRLFNSISVPGKRYLSAGYMSSYLRGCLLSYPGHSNGKLLRIYRTINYMQIVLKLRNDCLTLINFDDSVEMTIDELGLRQFGREVKNNCIWILTVSESENECNARLLAQTLAYNINVRMVNTKNLPPKIYRMDKYKLYEKNSIIKSIFRLKDWRGATTGKIFDDFCQMFIAMLDVVKKDENAIFYVLEGLFHNMQQAGYTIQRYTSKSAYSYALLVDMGKWLVQINFMAATMVNEYAERLEASNASWGLVSLFYDYDHAKHNFSLHMKVGRDFSVEVFTRSVCYNSDAIEITCPLVIKNRRLKRQKRGTGSLAQLVFGIARRGTQVASQYSFGSVVLNSLWHLTDNLVNWFYTVSDGIWTSILAHDTWAFVISWKARTIIRMGLGLLKVTAISLISGVVIPVLGAAVAVDDLKAATKALRAGDHTAFAIYNVVASSVFFLTSVVSLALGLLAMVGFATGPVGWVVFGIGSAFYFFGHVWKIIDDPAGFRNLINTLVDHAKQIIDSPIDYIEKEDIAAANHVLKNMLEIMEKNEKITNVFSTMPCSKGGDCEIAKIDFRKHLTIRDWMLMRTVNGIPRKLANKYKSLCRYLKTLEPLHALKLIARRNIVLSYICLSALAVGRIDNQKKLDALSLYLLEGKFEVYAKHDTHSIFELLKGTSCVVVGGLRNNQFFFRSVFNNCHIVGSKDATNTIDVSDLSTVMRYKIKNDNRIEMFDSTGTNLVGKMIVENINKLAVGAFGSSRNLEIICSNMSIEFKLIKDLCYGISARDCDIEKSDPYEKYHHNINVDASETCIYNSHFSLIGAVDIHNDAVNGKAAYTFTDLVGNVEMFLDANNGKMEHSFLWKSINITEIENVFADLDAKSRNFDLNFEFRERLVSLHLINTASPIRNTFADGSVLSYINDTYMVEIFHAKTKGHLWVMYSSLFDVFQISLVELHIYSERDQEFFMFSKEKIRVYNPNRITMPFSLFASGIERSEFKLESGYNVILMSTCCCECIQTRIREKGMWFEPVTADLNDIPEILLIDLTNLTDTIKQLDGQYALKTMIRQDQVEKVVMFVIYTLFWNLQNVEQSLVGSITLNSNLIDDSLYKKVKISASSDFTLQLSNNSQLELVPSPIFVNCYSPIVLLDRHTIESHQTIVFQNRSLMSYDVIKYDESTLIITDAATNLAKSLVISEINVPLLSIVIKNYKDDRMRSVKLKFEGGFEFIIGELDESRMLTEEEFDEKVFPMMKLIDDEKFSLNIDSRIDILGT